MQRKSEKIMNLGRLKREDVICENGLLEQTDVLTH